MENTADTNIHSEYLIKRWNKIAIATYTVTSHIKDSDHIKWDIRTKVVDIMSSIHEISAAYEGQKHTRIDACIAEISSFLSTTNIAVQAGLIGRMNYEILSKEIKLFIDELMNFKDKDLVLSPLQKEFLQVSQSVFKDQQKDHTVGQKSIGHSKGHIDENIKDGRKELIVKLLRENSSLSIANFVASIKGCSGKTIQRELNVLVSSGIVKKSGDRRWSTYSLKGV